MRHLLRTITEPGMAGAPTCSQCLNPLRRGTSAELVAAGLTLWFKVYGLPADHAERRPTFQPIADSATFMGAVPRGQAGGSRSRDWPLPESVRRTSPPPN